MDRHRQRYRSTPSPRVQRRQERSFACLPPRPARQRGGTRDSKVDGAFALLPNINSAEIRRQCGPLISAPDGVLPAGAQRRWLKLDERRFAATQSPSPDTQPPTGGKLHAQIGESLRKLWWKVGPCQPPPSRPALLPQSLQGELPCENGEGSCVHAALVWLRTSPGFIGVAGIERGQPIEGSATQNPSSATAQATAFCRAQSMLRPGMPAGEANIRR
jgi:hypothetical protein